MRKTIRSAKKFQSTYQDCTHQFLLSVTLLSSYFVHFLLKTTTLRNTSIDIMNIIGIVSEPLAKNEIFLRKSLIWLIFLGANVSQQAKVRMPHQIVILIIPKTMNTKDRRSCYCSKIEYDTSRSNAAVYCCPKCAKNKENLQIMLTHKNGLLSNRIKHIIRLNASLSITSTVFAFSDFPSLVYVFITARNILKC